MTDSPATIPEARGNVERRRDEESGAGVDRLLPAGPGSGSGLRRQAPGASGQEPVRPRELGSGVQARPEHQREGLRPAWQGRGERGSLYDAGDDDHHDDDHHDDRHESTRSRGGYCGDILRSGLAGIPGVRQHRRSTSKRVPGHDPWRQERPHPRHRDPRCRFSASDRQDGRDMRARQYDHYDHYVTTWGRRVWRHRHVANVNDPDHSERLNDDLHDDERRDDDLYDPDHVLDAHDDDTVLIAAEEAEGSGDAAESPTEEGWPFSAKATASLPSREDHDWPLRSPREWVMPPDPLERTPPDAWGHGS